MSLADEIIYGTRQGVERLIQHGANPNEIDVYGFTPLIQTAIMRRHDVAKFLLEHGADVNGRDLLGRTALHFAVDNHDLPLCHLLLEQGADPNAYSRGGQPVLVQPLLRNQEQLKKILYEHGGVLSFAQDFIATKVLSHRFELKGFLDIVNTKGKFIEVDLEGFYLEFTLGIVENSLRRFRNHFMARKMRRYFYFIEIMYQALANADALMGYKHYMIDISKHNREINKLLDHDPLILPIGYGGHAITIIRSGSLLVKCDRSQTSHLHGNIVLYRITKPAAFSKELLKGLIYKRQSKHFVEKGIHEYLGLLPITQLPFPSQIIGNCSWANVEAIIPAIVLLIMLRSKQQHSPSDIISYKEAALDLYEDWMRWDRDVTLNEFIHGFYSASPARKAAKVSILAAILFQSINHRDNQDLRWAEKIFNILTIPEYDYVLRSYIETYAQRKSTPAGKNLLELMALCSVSLAE